MAAGEIIMLGAVVLGAAIFIKVIPQLQGAAAAGGGATTAAAATPGSATGTTTSCGTVNVGDAGCPSCVTVGSGCVCSGNSACTCDAAQCPSTAADNPCSRVTSSCIAFNGKCVRQGNSNCSCSGCTQTHASSTANKPARPTTLQGSNPKTGTSNPAPSSIHPLSSFIPGLKNIPPKSTAPRNPLGTIVPGLA